MVDDELGGLGQREVENDIRARHAVEAVRGADGRGDLEVIGLLDQPKRELAHTSVRADDGNPYSHVLIVATLDAMVSWREAAADDLAAQSLLTEYFASRALGFPPEQGEYQPVFPKPEDFTPPRGAFLVVEGEDLAGEAADVGCGGIRMIDLDDGETTFEVKHLWLQPHVRGGGVGRALLQELERRAVALGATRLVLDTNASLEAAGGLYRSNGYLETEPYNDNPNATTWFAKKL